MLKKIIIGCVALFGLSGCFDDDDADVASRNLSKAADNFEIVRRIVFYNGITNDYMLSITGRCSIGAGTSAKSITVTCKRGQGQYLKHILGLSDNVTYFVEQMQDADVSVDYYRISFKPTTILPDLRMQVGK